MTRLETIDIIKALVSELEVVVNVKSVTVNGNGTQTIETCDTKHISIGLQFTIISTTYTVVSFVRNESFTVEGSAVITGKTITLDAPKFFHGSIYETNKELTGIPDMQDKVPMIYLRRPYTDVFDNRFGQNDRVSDCSIFFLTEDNFSEFDSDMRDIECINPMRSLLYSFVELLNSRKGVNIIESFTVDNREKFGVVSQNGVEKVLFDTPLSGCELTISIPIMKSFKCNC